MAPSPADTDDKRELAAAIKNQINVEEAKNLSALQSVVLQAHAHYKRTFDKLMKSTNGQILDHLRIQPSIIANYSQSIAAHNVNEDVLAAPPQVKGLLISSLQTVRDGLEDIYEKGELLLSGDELKEFKASKKKQTAVFEHERKEFQSLIDKVVLLRTELAAMKKRGQKGTVKDGDESSKNSTLTEPALLREGYEKVIADLVGHIIYLRHNQSSFMFFHFKSLISFESPLMNQIRTAHQAGSPMAITNFTFSKLPEHIEGHRCAQLIEDLNAAVELLRLEYNNALRIFLECTELAVAALDQESESYAKDKKALKDRARGMKALLFVFEEFDLRVFWVQAEMQRHGDTISKIARNSMNAKMYAASLKEAHEKREKLVQDLVKLRRKRCDTTQCHFIEKEKRQNAIFAGAGTQERDRFDREAVEALLAGTFEPWKQDIKDLEEERRSF